MTFTTTRLLLPINYFMKTLSVFFISICCCFLTAVFPAHAQSQKDEKGLFLIDGVWLYSSPSLSSEKLEEIPALKPITILEVGHTWEIIDGPDDDLCSKSPWVKIKTPSGKTGWVFGSWIFKICNDDSKISEVEKDTVKFLGEDYKLTILNNYTYPVGDENGLTACSPVYYIALYTKNFNRVILFLSEARRSPEIIYCCLFDDARGSENVTGMEFTDETVILHISAGYQEGSATYDLIMVKDGDDYTGLEKNYILTY
jgi:hypothetical protein